MAVSDGERQSLCLPTVNSTDGPSGSQNLPASPPPLYSDIPGTVPLSQGQANANPPSYNDVVNSEASPPTYQSLFGQVIEARKNSNGFVDSLGKVGKVLIQIILLTVIYVIPVVMLLFGIKYFGECPLFQFIPVYLIIGGSSAVLKNLLFCYSSGITPGQILIQMILNCFLIIWFVIGCIIIFNIGEPVYEDETSPLYCNKTLHVFFAWLILTPFACFLILLMIVGSPDNTRN